MDSPLIAVINHDNVFLDLMHELLTGEGYEAVCWHAADDTFDHLREVQPAFAIVDIPAHRRDAAWAFIERIHDAPATAHIPVLVCTADVWHVRRRASVLLEYRYAIVEKPFAVEAMLRQVRELLSSARLAPIRHMAHRYSHDAAST